MGNAHWACHWKEQAKRVLDRMEAPSRRIVGIGLPRKTTPEAALLEFCFLVFFQFCVSSGSFSAAAASSAAPSVISSLRPLECLQRLSFIYTPTWPLSLTLTPQILQQYNRVLRLRLLILMSQEILSELRERTKVRNVCDCTLHWYCTSRLYQWYIIVHEIRLGILLVSVILESHGRFLFLILCVLLRFLFLILCVIRHVPKNILDSSYVRVPVTGSRFSFSRMIGRSK